MGKPSYKVELSQTAEKTAVALKGKDRSLVVEALRIISRDPYERKQTVKLAGPYTGYRRVRKGNWRVVYSVEGNVVRVAYIKRRSEDTYK